VLGPLPSIYLQGNLANHNLLKRHVFWGSLRIRRGAWPTRGNAITNGKDTKARGDTSETKPREEMGA